MQFASPNPHDGRDAVPWIAGRVIPWADVHYSDPAGRLVVTLEADGVDGSIERLEEIQRIPNVLSVSLAEYRFEGNEE